MDTVEPETAAWSTEEVETLTNGVGRFEDDLHQIFPFLPNKTGLTVTSFYYQFLVHVRDMSTVTRLFRLAEECRERNGTGTGTGTGTDSDSGRGKPDRKRQKGGANGYTVAKKGRGKGTVPNEEDDEEVQSRLAASQRFLRTARQNMPKEQYVGHHLQPSERPTNQPSDRSTEEAGSQPKVSITKPDHCPLKESLLLTALPHLHLHLHPYPAGTSSWSTCSWRLIVRPSA